MDQVADVVVIGGGIAGLSAANRAAQLNLKVIVLERGAEEKYLCNSRFTGGTLHVCLDDIMAGEEVHFAAIESATRGFARRDLARTVAHDAAQAVRWLQQEGMRFMKASPSPYHRWVLAPPGRVRPGLDWEGRAGDVLLRTLGANLAKRGGQIVRNTRARALIVEEGRCRGVEAEEAGQSRRFAARAVVIADGGFQGNPELMAKYVTGEPAKLKQRGAGTGRGDGLLMAQAAGASIVVTDRFYGHLLSRDALHNDQLWPYPYLDALVTAGIVVNSQGSRFFDEGLGGIYAANTVATLADPLSASLVFDQAIWDGPGRNGMIPANPHVPGVGGTMLKANDIAGLAGLMGVDVTALTATVQAYNDGLSKGNAAEISPPRTDLKGKPMPILRAPFYAIPACAGVTYTMGGIAIDGESRVLRPDDSAIEGLFAAGCCTGGLEGGPAVGYVGGLAKSAVTGLRAAETIAASLAS